MLKRILLIALLLVATFSVTMVIFNQHPSLAQNVKKPVDQHKEGKKKSTPKVGLAVGNRAPNIMLENTLGQSVNLADYRGKKVLLNFWATWCSPCREEIPQLVQFYKNMDQSKMAILAVNAASMETGGMTAVQNFAQKNGMRFPILLDKQEEALTAYGIVTIPTTYLLDEKGLIIAKHSGPVDVAWINQHLK